MKTLVLDIETTGLPMNGATYEKDFSLFPYIVSMSWKINDQETRYFIINQEGRPIPPASILIHGITDEMAMASSCNILDALVMLLNDGLGADLAIGHNIYFDTSIIKANILRIVSEGKTDKALFDAFEELVHKDRRIDTMKGTIKFCNLPGARGPKWPKLTELHFKLFNENFNAHNAKDDVDATYRCFLKLREMKIL